MRVLEIDGKTWDASVFGQRLGHSTKESAPLAGITLDGQAAVSDAVFEILTPDDAEALARLPLGNRDARRDFATGRPLGNLPPTATLNVPVGPTARTPLVFSISASDPNSDALASSWNFGNSPASNSSTSVSHTWAVGGTYTASVTISDMKGGGVTKTQLVTVITDNPATLSVRLTTPINGANPGRGFLRVACHQIQ